MLHFVKSVGLLFIFLTMSHTAKAAFSLEEAGTHAVQQDEVCTGVVTDANGESLIGATVLVKGTSNGTITDVDGHFTLNGVQPGDVVEIGFVGYVTQDVKWDGAPIRVTLEEDTQTLDKVVVVGYGVKQKRSTMTTAISKMDSRVLESAAIGNAAQALQGSVSGLRVINTSGAPGSAPTIVYYVVGRASGRQVSL